jgi:phosphoribosylformylglycinamidine synthase
MIFFFGSTQDTIFALHTTQEIDKPDIEKLEWLFSNKVYLDLKEINATFVGPRSTMITPWSTNAIEIMQNMGINGVQRIESFQNIDKHGEHYDRMLFEKYDQLNQSIFDINITPEPIKFIDDINAYNQEEGLALSDEEIVYLQEVAKKKGRLLTDSEIFGFSQVNSEHCRHKIFNGTFIIDGKEKEESLFQLIKKTSKTHPNGIVSAYKDNVAFVKGPQAVQFSPKSIDKPDSYERKAFNSIISLKAETHNFPTTVEPFSGAATGSGGEIRDRMAGGKGSIPLAGTALYMTSYPRINDQRNWENSFNKRPWLYQTPLDILIKASNGASDFGNKFGQPLICGSLLTFEHSEDGYHQAYDKVIMQAGGVGYGKEEQALKDTPQKDDVIVIMGGDNYRIGMGGAAVSSKDTGDTGEAIELNAIQRSNPEMQKRVSNVIRGLVEASDNPIVSIHDHGAGGHLNCLSELVEDTGGAISIDALPIGDTTLSDKEIIGNESQERMGLVINKEDIALLTEACERERAPIYKVGHVTGDHKFSFHSEARDSKPMDVEMDELFGSSPKTIMTDETITRNYAAIEYSSDKLYDYVADVLRIEAVACKDWLTNKVDRCVGGRVAKQQCCGPLQLPLNNVAVMAMDYEGQDGIATSMGHAPIVGLLDPKEGAYTAITEALTNIVWAPLQDNITSVSLSANWMWPAKNPGENARLYEAVQATSEFAIALGINIPTGKDSMSMKQKYSDKEVLAPGTVVISSVGHCNDINNIIEPVLKKDGGDIYYINLSQVGYKLGGSSFAQTQNKVGTEAPKVASANYIKNAFNTIQELIKKKKISSGHDISAGGMITTLLEMCFSDNGIGASINLVDLQEDDIIKNLLSENTGLIFQSTDSSITQDFAQYNITCKKIGVPTDDGQLTINHSSGSYSFEISKYRDIWYETSYLFDKHQSGEELARTRYENYKEQALRYTFPQHHSGIKPEISTTNKPKAAIIREKGSNSEREMAHAMYLAGFDVRDVHMTDLISGRETLEDIQFIGAVGGFSNSDVLGSAKGWAGAFKYNNKAKTALDNFFKRDDVLSVGICNGCQLFMELNLINPEHDASPKMTFNDSHKHESGFTSVTIKKNNSVMLSSLAGSTLGVWISHGEGKFVLPKEESEYNIVAKYGYNTYPANPNGSTYNAAMMTNSDGRHLVMMPHIERSIFPWNWAYYPDERNDQISPWIEAFTNARDWILKKNS